MNLGGMFDQVNMRIKMRDIHEQSMQNYERLRMEHMKRYLEFQELLKLLEINPILPEVRKVPVMKEIIAETAQFCELKTFFYLTDVCGDCLEIDEKTLIQLPYFDMLLQMRDHMKTGITKDNTIYLEKFLSLEGIKMALQFISDKQDIKCLIESVHMDVLLSDILNTFGYLGVITELDEHQLKTQVRTLLFQILLGFSLN